MKNEFTGRFKNVVKRLANCQFKAVKIITHPNQQLT